MAITYHAGRRVQGTSTDFNSGTITRIGSLSHAETAATGSTTWTYTHTNASGSNRIMLVSIGTETGGNVVTGVDYGGQALVEIANAEDPVGTNDVNMWYLLESGIASASNTTITITQSANTTKTASCAISYEGVDQTTPVSEYATDVTAVATLTGLSLTEAVGNLLVCIVGTGSSRTPTYPATMTEQYDSNDYAFIGTSLTLGDRLSITNGSIDPAPTMSGVTRNTGISVELSAYATNNIVNAQVGSRFEETDTRKMYHYVDLTNGTTSEKFWGEEGTVIGTYPPTRGVWASGYTNAGGGRLNTMDYVTIASSGSINTATDFGDLTVGRETPAGVSSYTRGIIGGGIDLNSGVTGAITAEYITIMTKGNASEFGDLTVCRSGVAAVSDRSRGVWYGGQLNNNTVNTIDYVTIDTRSAASSWGSMVTNRDMKLCTGVNDATRGCFGGGHNGAASNIIDYITIGCSTASCTATNFGTLSRSNYNVGSVSSTIRGVFAGGNSNSTVIDYVTIGATTIPVGTATVFGSLSTGISGCQGNSDLTRGIFAGGWITTNMQVMTIDTGSGGATTFGDLTVARDAPAGGLTG